MTETQLTKEDVKTFYQCECGKISYWYEPRCVRCDSDKIVKVEVIDIQKLKQIVALFNTYKNDPIAFKDKYESVFERFMIDVLKWSGESLYYPDEHYIEDECKGDFNTWLLGHCLEDGLK